MSGIMVMSCAPQQKKLVYPETAKVDTVDVYFGTQVPDPYRWLENDTSAATTAWVEAQNKVTNEYLSQIPFRENLLKRLTTLADYEKISAPIKKHGKYYFSKNDGLQNQSVASLARQYPRTRRPETEGRAATANPPPPASPKRRSSTPANPGANKQSCGGIWTVWPPNRPFPSVFHRNSYWDGGWRSSLG